MSGTFMSLSHGWKESDVVHGQLLVKLWGPFIYWHSFHPWKSEVLTPGVQSLEMFLRISPQQPLLLLAAPSCFIASH